jgi:hypothetical protein
VSWEYLILTEMAKDPKADGTKLFPTSTAVSGRSFKLHLKDKVLMKKSTNYTIFIKNIPSPKNSEEIFGNVIITVG